MCSVSGTPRLWEANRKSKCKRTAGDTAGELVNILDAEFDKEVTRVDGKNAKADTILNAISACVTDKIETNPAFYKSIAEQIKDVINEYQDKRLSEDEKLIKAEKLKELIRSGTKSSVDYPQEFENQNKLITIYDNLHNLLGDLEVVDFEIIVKNLTIKIDEIYSNASKKPEWSKNKDVENEITSEIENSLWEIEDEYQIRVENKEEIYQTMRKVGIDLYGG